METRTNWGIVAFSGVFAVGIIAVAITGAVRAAPNTQTDTVAVTQGDTSIDTSAGSPWRAALDAVVSTSASTTQTEYRAPAELGTTASLSQELIAGYLKLRSENKLGTAEGDAAVTDLIKRNVKAVAPSDTYALSSLAPSATMNLEQYTGDLATIMQKSAAIQEYELTTFAHTMRVEDHNGTPALDAAAHIYRTIEKQLIAQQVPPSLAAQHLGLVKSVAFLAQSVELMAGWSGDPIDALGYIDAFVKADRGVRVSLDTLFATIVKVAKQQ